MDSDTWVALESIVRASELSVDIEGSYSVVESLFLNLMTGAMEIGPSMQCLYGKMSAEIPLVHEAFPIRALPC